MLNRVWLVLVLLTAVGCQSVQQKRLDLLTDRVHKLKPLSEFKPVTCRVKVELTEPAKARYAQMFPASKDQLDQIAYTWRARESACELTPVERGPVTDNLKGFLYPALCVLLQTHWVNSPFDEFPYSPERITGLEDRPDAVLLKSSDKGEAGLVLDAKTFNVETRTKSRGTFSAAYADQDGEWLPEQIAQKTAGGTQVVVDGFAWESERLGGRRMPKSFWISAGEEQAHRHSQLQFSECRP